MSWKTKISCGKGVWECLINSKTCYVKFSDELTKKGNF